MGEPAQAQARVDADPAAATALRVRLAEIEKEFAVLAAQDAKEEREALLARFLDPVLFEEDPAPRVPRPLTALDFTLREAVGLPRPPGALPGIVSQTSPVIIKPLVRIARRNWPRRRPRSVTFCSVTSRMPTRKAVGPSIVAAPKSRSASRIVISSITQPCVSP